MIFVKEGNCGDFKPFDTRDDLHKYLNTRQCNAIIDARNKIDKLLFTKNYYVSFFDIYISGYICCIVFEVDSIDRHAYLNNMRGQWFVDQEGRLYVKNGKDKEYIEDAVYHFVARVGG